MAGTLPQRRLVPVEETWDLADIFPSVEACEAERTAVEADVTTVTRWRGHLADGPQALLQCFSALEALLARNQRVQAYASLRMAEDGSDPERQAGAAAAAAADARLRSDLAFLQPELLALPDGMLERWLDEEPDLAPFSGFVHRMLRNRPHTLGPEGERVLAALRQVLATPGTVYRRAMTSDVRFPPFVDAAGQSQPNSFLLYEDRYERSEAAETRRRAYASFVAGLQPYRHSFAATMAAEVRQQVAMAGVRGHGSATRMFLHGQEVPEEVYHRQLDVLQTDLAPHWRRLARLRRRVLGLEDLMYCDLEAPLDPGFEPQVSYENVASTLLEALSVLGGEYVAIIDRALHQRWVDRALNAGKGNVRFCNAVVGVHPYICTGWTGTMRSAFILAHELGHAAHAELYMARQRPIEAVAPAHESTFFIEAPSTANELLLHAHLVRRAPDPRTRRWTTLQLVATYHHNFVRHLLEGELQRRMYAHVERGGAITAPWLDQVQGEILERFWGDTVQLDDGARMTWMRQPHYYMGLYSWTYSTGLTVATEAVSAIGREGAPAVERWLAAQRAGLTRGGMEVAALAGVDMTRPEPLHRTVAFVGALVDELERSYASEA